MPDRVACPETPRRRQARLELPEINGSRRTFVGTVSQTRTSPSPFEWFSTQRQNAGVLSSSTRVDSRNRLSMLK